MYIRKIEITNIKGIDHFEMDFSEVSKPGWHVLIGDNGSGKTTILRCIGMIALEQKEAQAITLYNGYSSKNWIRNSCLKGEIRWLPDLPENDTESISCEAVFTDVGLSWNMFILNEDRISTNFPFRIPFSCGYGPLRRLTGKNDSFFQGGTRSNFSTLFSEEEGLVQTQIWLQGLVLDSTSKPEKKNELDFVIQFINTSELLPDGATLTDKIDSVGVKIRDAAGNEVYFRDASAGFRSILTLTLDLIKNMIAHYGIQKVMENATANTINLPGVVLIDEVDAHLHPNWQIRIGKWFTDFFPQIQFIVTTHSPLICRGSLNGQIWHLKTPGSGEESRPVTEIEWKRLVFGNILTAFGTEVFGQDITGSANAVEKEERINRLQMKSIKGTITDEESEELQELKTYLYGSLKL